MNLKRTMTGKSDRIHHSLPFENRNIRRGRGNRLGRHIAEYAFHFGQNAPRSSME
jgi:hypothetical protein